MFVIQRAFCSCSLPSGTVDLETNASTTLPSRQIQRSFTFWAGGLAGVASAAVTPPAAWLSR